MVRFTADLNNREDNCFCSTENILFLQPEVKQAILIWGCFVLFFKMLLNKKTGGFQNERNHLGMQSQSHMGAHFIHILFPKCKNRILGWGWLSGGVVGHDIFSSASQVELNSFSDFCS